MSKITYNKLVRDGIPKIIEQDGNTYAIEKVNDREALELLHLKLQEELNEYLQSGETEELADLLEVIHGILSNKQLAFEDLEAIRLDKAAKRGGFKDGIKLLWVEKQTGR